MIAKTYKLNHKDIVYISKRGIKKRNELGLIMVIKQYPNRPYHQLGVALSTKISKSAVHRNMIKRILYPLLHQYISMTQGSSPNYGKFFILLNEKNPHLQGLFKDSTSLGGLTSNLKSYFTQHIQQPHFNHLIQTCLRSLHMLNSGS